MNATDKQNLIAYLDNIGVVWKLFNDPEFIAEEALKEGAVETVNFLESDFAFDVNGRCVGHYTTSANSWRKRK